MQVSSFVLKDCEKKLRQGLDNLALEATTVQIEKLIQYLQLLNQWNQRMNLTAVRHPNAMVSRHLLDSLVIKPYLQQGPIIDVGTGAGLPGIPLSIMMPEISFSLLDSNHKKQVFVSQAVKLLSLENVQCIHSDVKTYEPIQKFSTILTRAFAPLTQMINLTAHLLADNGRFFAMLGKVDERMVVPPGFEIERVVSLIVPGESAPRHLGIIARR